MLITRAFRFRLRPKYHQLVQFHRACEAARYAWNWCLRLCEREQEDALVDAGVLARADLDACSKRKQRIAVIAKARACARARGLKIEAPQVGRARLYKAFAEHRDTEMPWLREMHSHTYSYPIERLVNAYKTWWKSLRSGGRRFGGPRPKAYGIHDSFTIQINARMMARKQIRIPGVGWVACFRDPLAILEQKGRPCSVTVTRVADHWYASVAVRDLQIAEPRTPAGPPVGLDLGVNSLVTLSSAGEIRRVEPPRPLERELHRLAKLQRAHQRKQKRSRRRYRSQMRIARLHERIAQSRSDFLHKLSRYLVAHHRAIGVEGFDVHDLVACAVEKGHGTSATKTKRRQNILDGAWGELRRQLGYKCDWYGAELVLLDKFDPTDQSCHRCGAKNKMEPTTNEYRCSSCSLIITRQENTALLLESFARGNPPESTGGHPGPEARGPDGSAASSDVGNQPGGSVNDASFRSGAGSISGSRPFLQDERGDDPKHGASDVGDHGATVQNHVSGTASPQTGVL